jgi:hypothetical protein
VCCQERAQRAPSPGGWLNSAKAVIGNSLSLRGVPIQARRAPSHHAELFTQVVAHRARYHGVKVSFGGLFLDLMSLCLNAAGMQTAAGTDLDPLPLVRREIAAEKSRERAFDRLLAQEEAKRKA